MKFKIVVPTYNTEHWIARCLQTIQLQTHSDFECIVFDDASTDRTGLVIDRYFEANPDSRFRVVHNTKNVKALANIVEGFRQLESKKDPESVLMVIDGDDFLFSEYVLEIVAHAYEQTGALLTYGNHVHHPTGGKSNCEPLPQEVIANRSFRKYKFVTSHLRTFKSKLWNTIQDEDLRDEDGSYYGSGWDVAFMMPMLEMAAERILFIPNVLYCYNRFNPLSDDQIRQPEQHRIEMRVRNGRKYDLLEKRGQ
jgi:glycosyltransferase involved in cell wall biosynthesis